MFGAYALVQRCQVHKKRNVLDHLPEHATPPARKAMQHAYALDDCDKAKAQLERLARSLDEQHPSAASSLREGLDKMLTVLRLGIGPTLRKSLATTNPIESTFSMESEKTWRRLLAELSSRCPNLVRAHHWPTKTLNRWISRFYVVDGRFDRCRCDGGMANLMMVVAALLVVSSTATAQPSQSSPTEPGPEPNAAPTLDVRTASPAMYVQTGVEFGGTQRAIIFAATAEGGYRIARSPFWIHAMALLGSASGVDEQTFSGSVVQLRVGIEARECVANGIACAVGGVDVGYSHTQYMAEDDSDDSTGPLVIPRIGLDLGGAHLRVRPGVEIGFGDHGFEQVGISAAVAFQW